MKLRRRPVTDPLSYRLLSGGLLWCGLALSSGCDSGSGVAPVTGTVTFDGAKVSTGAITFYPISGGRPATGQIGADGAYTLSTFVPNDGALIGSHKVTIESRTTPNAPAAPASLEEEIARGASAPSGPVVVKWLVPEKYASTETSGLTTTVEPGGKPIDFALP